MTISQVNNSSEPTSAPDSYTEYKPVSLAGLVSIGLWAWQIVILLAALIYAPFTRKLTPPLNNIALVIGELTMLSLIPLLGTVAMRHRALKGEHDRRERAAIGDAFAAAQPPISTPPFIPLLRRNVFVTVIFLPALALATAVMCMDWVV